MIGKEKRKREEIIFLFPLSVHLYQNERCLRFLHVY